MTRLRLSPDGYHRITLVALVMLCVIIVSGAAVRLTGSGLGCSDWPACEDHSFVAEADAHAWIEFANRLFTGVVSLAVILAVGGSLVRRPRRPDLTRWSLGLVAGVVAQILLGAVVVLSELEVWSVSAHFLVSMVLVANAVVLHARAGTDEPWVPAPVTRAVRRLAAAVAALVAVVLVLGSVVTAAGPHRGDPDAPRLEIELAAVARVHSVAAWLTVGALAVLLVLIHRRGSAGTLGRPAWMLAAALGVQGTLGYLQYAQGVPAPLVAAHVLGSVVVWISALHLALVAQGARRHRDVAAPPAASRAAVPPSDRPDRTLARV